MGHFYLLRCINNFFFNIIVNGATNGARDTLNPMLIFDDYLSKFMSFFSGYFWVDSKRRRMHPSMYGDWSS